MGILVSMGGFIFGYDTGQISGFLAMPNFLERFGQQKSDGTFYFSNVRSGIIVGLLSIGTLVSKLIRKPAPSLRHMLNRSPISLRSERWLVDRWLI